MKNRSHYAAEKPLFVCILIFISSFSVLLYLNTTYGKFVYDDFKIIVENCFINEWKYFPKIFTKDYFTISGEMSYRPVVTISYFIDYAIWHSNPFGFHLTNIFLHTLNTVLFYLFLRDILQKKKIVLLSTLFFVTHLILVETVNAIGYREDIFASTFTLVSLIYFIKSERSECAHDDARKVPSGKSSKKSRFALYYGISLVAYLCALFSKEMAITLPALLLLLTVFSERKTWRGIVKRFNGIYIGYIVISLFYLIIRFSVFSNPALKTAYQPGGLWVNILTMIKVTASYVKLSFFPFSLNADYVVPLVRTPFEVSFLLSLGFLISIFVVFAGLCKSRSMFACWMAWFFVTLLPVMNIVPVGNIMAERYLYMPVMGFCVAKGILIYRITDPDLSTRAMQLRRIVQLVLIILTTGGYGVSIIRNNGDWRDELTLWTKTITRSPNSHRAHCNLGVVYMEGGLTERALVEYQTSLRLNPLDASVHNNLGTVYTKKGLDDKALTEYKESIRLDNNYAQPHNNLGNIYFNQGLVDKARAEYEEALRIRPNYALAHNGMGNIYNTTGEMDNARDAFNKALLYDNRYTPARINLGVNYAKRGQLSEAIAEFKKSIEIDNSQPNSHFNLGLAYEKSGRSTDAIREYNTVIQLDQGNFNALYALGTLYRSLGLIDNAIDVFRQIITSYPDNVNAYKTLIFLYLDGKKDVEVSRYYLKELLRIDRTLAEKEDIRQILKRLNLVQD